MYYTCLQKIAEGILWTSKGVMTPYLGAKIELEIISLLDMWHRTCQVFFSYLVTEYKDSLWNESYV